MAADEPPERRPRTSRGLGRHPGVQRAGQHRPDARGLQAAVRSRHEVLIVYDFDEDTTVPVVRGLQVRMPGVRLLRNDLGRGVLNAMKAGMADARAPYVIVSMADGSDDHRVVDAMVALARSGADVVAASRYMRGGAQIGGPPAEAVPESGRRTLAVLVRRGRHSRRHEQLQALQPALPRRA